MARNNDTKRATPHYRPCKKIHFWIRLAERVRGVTKKEPSKEKIAMQTLNVKNHIKTPKKRYSVGALHFIRFHVWTQNICSVFSLKVAF